MSLDSNLETVIHGVLLVIGTGVAQVAAQATLSRALRVVPQPGGSAHPTFYMLAHSVTAVVVLMAGHMVQVVLWALFYHFDLHELGSLRTALYFSLASFTTVGANELNLTQGHRIVGALESAAGMLMFGWSTALLVRVVQRSDRD